MNKIGHNRTTFPKENVTQLLGSMWFARHFAYGDGKTMTKSLPSASILSREDICATAKTPGLVIPFSQHACGHGLLNIPPRPQWDLKMGSGHAQFQGKDLKTSPVFAK